jgi:hypothetical protein
MSQSAKSERKNPLLEIERAVHAEAREWERQRLEEKLQKEADRVGKVFPPQPKKGPAAARNGDPTAHPRRDG